jgi:hypothetical protein
MKKIKITAEDVRPGSIVILSQSKKYGTEYGRVGRIYRNKYNEGRGKYKNEYYEGFEVRSFYIKEHLRGPAGRSSYFIHFNQVLSVDSF